MDIGRIDVFENEAEISQLVSNLQAKGREYMAKPDDFWSTETHDKALKSARKMGKKVLAQL